MKGLAAAALAMLIGVVVLKLALAPFYERYDANQCREAYTRARTRTDTIAVDFWPYASPRRGRNPRCGELRVLRPTSEADLSALGQPDEEL